MKNCPKCFHNNLPTATTCSRCGLSFDMTAVVYSRMCPAGRHPMDPTWVVCAFCKAEGLVMDEFGSAASVPYTATGVQKTAFEAQGSRGGGTKVESRPWDVLPDMEGPSGTDIEQAAGRTKSEDVRKTRMDHEPALPLQPGSPLSGKTGFARVGEQPGQLTGANGRRIVGILISYTWSAEGQIFPVREGRNWIGRDPQQADIVMEQDQTLSAVNTTISFRSRFTIGDKDSMGGTYVNGQPVEESAQPLPNYARIRTGSTSWTFIAVEPGPAE